MRQAAVAFSCFYHSLVSRNDSTRFHSFNTTNDIIAVVDNLIDIKFGNCFAATLRIDSEAMEIV